MYFSEICKIRKSEMQPVIGIVLAEVLKSIVAESGVVPQTAPIEKDFSLDSDSDDGQEQLVGMDIETSFLDEKTAAICTLGVMSLHCSKLLFPHMATIITSLQGVSLYFHENVRYHVCLTLTQISFGL